MLIRSYSLFVSIFSLWSLEPRLLLISLFPIWRLLTAYAKENRIETCCCCYKKVLGPVIYSSCSFSHISLWGRWNTHNSQPNTLSHHESEFEFRVFFLRFSTARQQLIDNRKKGETQIFRGAVCPQLVGITNVLCISGILCSLWHCLMCQMKRVLTLAYRDWTCLFFPYLFCPLSPVSNNNSNNAKREWRKRLMFFSIGIRCYMLEMREKTNDRITRNHFVRNSTGDSEA